MCIHRPVFCLRDRTAAGRLSTRVCHRLPSQQSSCLCYCPSRRVSNSDDRHRPPVDASKLLRIDEARDSPSLRTVSPGTILDGRYRLERSLESGGFSSVWTATATAGQSPTTVVVKTPNGGTNAQAEVEAAFKREQRFIQQFRDALQPTSIARQIDWGTEGSERFVVYERLHGQPLDRALTEGTVEPHTSTVERIFGPLCHALAFFHLNGYLYLDLKPENVVLVDTTTPVLLDFNMAVPATGADGRVVHQDGYRPPEQTPSGDGTISARSDVYACGALLYLLVTGNEPSTRRTELPLRPRRVSRCPESLASVVRQATAPRPERRYSDALELLAALVEALDHPGYPVGLYHPGSDTHVPVGPSTTVGRATGRGERPDLWVADTDQYLSPVHFRLAGSTRSGQWRLVDESTNGTYVDDGRDVQYVLSEEGYRRLERNPDATEPTVQPPTETTLSDGDRIYPVAREYDHEFVFHDG